MSLIVKRHPALLGTAVAAALLVAVGAAVLPRLGHSAPTAAHAAAGAAGTGAAAAPLSSEPPSPELAAATAGDATPTDAAGPSAAPSAPTSAPPPATEAVAEPVPPAAPAPSASSRLAPGQRVDPTGAQVQEAVDALHQRIPLFAPTDQQLRTFADAVCASFDQGQTQAQVQSTVQQAVSRIQGASLSAADAGFAVGTVVQLRCPGWLS